jgi:DNA-binding MarR family transcriptional regulator
MARPSKLEKLADELWTLSFEEVDGFLEVITKIHEAKAMLRTAEQGSVVTKDRAAADDLREIRRYLENPDISLSGPEVVILGSFYKMLEGAEALDTRALNITLDSYGRKPSNTTTTVENLEKKGLMEFLKGEDLHAHKSFLLTETGKAEARDLVDRLSRQLD